MDDLTLVTRCLIESTVSHLPPRLIATTAAKATVNRALNLFGASSLRDVFLQVAADHQDGKIDMYNDNEWITSDMFPFILKLCEFRSDLDWNYGKRPTLLNVVQVLHFIETGDDTIFQKYPSPTETDSEVTLLYSEVSTPLAFDETEVDSSFPQLDNSE